MCSFLKGGISERVAVSIAAFISDECTHLIEEATPPRRMVEGCSVKEISFASGGSICGEGVDRR